MQQMVWKGCTQWNKPLLQPDPHPHHRPRLLKVRRSTHHPRVWYLLIKITVRFLNRSLAQEFQDNCMPGDCRIDVWRLLVHTGSTDPGEWVPNKHTQAPPSPQNTVMPLTWYFKNSFPIFSEQEKPIKGATSAPLKYSVLMLGSGFSC